MTSARGRPRDPARHESVLAATRALLASGGYSALTFSEVAQRAGVTRQLVHRWWSAKSALVSEALFTAPESWPMTYAGPLEADLRLFLTALVDYACRDDVRAGVIGLMSDVESTTELPGLEEGLLHPLEESLRALVEAGVDRGEARTDIDVRLTLNTLRGAVTMHLLADLTPRDVIVDHLTDLAHGALLRR